MAITKVQTDQHGRPLVFGKGDFVVRASGDGFRAYFFDGKTLHEGPENSEPGEAIEVLCFEMDEADVDWRAA